RREIQQIQREQKQSSPDIASKEGQVIKQHTSWIDSFDMELKGSQTALTSLKYDLAKTRLQAEFSEKFTETKEPKKRESREYEKTSEKRIKSRHGTTDSIINRFDHIDVSPESSILKLEPSIRQDQYDNDKIVPVDYLTARSLVDETKSLHEQVAIAKRILQKSESRKLQGLVDFAEKLLKDTQTQYKQIRFIENVQSALAKVPGSEEKWEYKGKFTEFTDDSKKYMRKLGTIDSELAKMCKELLGTHQKSGYQQLRDRGKA